MFGDSFLGRENHLLNHISVNIFFREGGSKISPSSTYMLVTQFDQFRPTLAPNHHHLDVYMGELYFKARY